MNRNTDDLVYAVKDSNGNYFIGYNHWDKQIRKAKLYRSYKYAKETMDDSRFADREKSIVQVRITEVGMVCDD